MLWKTTRTTPSKSIRSPFNRYFSKGTALNDSGWNCSRALRCVPNSFLGSGIRRVFPSLLVFGSKKSAIWRVKRAFSVAQISNLFGTNDFQFLFFSSTHSSFTRQRGGVIESLKQSRRRRAATKTPQICIFDNQKQYSHALHVHFPFFDILQTFSFFLRREMTCFAVVWTTWAYDDKC